MLTPGEPAGIGPDIIAQIAQQAWPVELVVVSDPDLLLERAKAIGLPLQLSLCHAEETPLPHQAGRLKYVSVPLNEKVVPGKLNPANAHYVLRTLELAAEWCLQKKADAVVTGPVHKGVINDAGIPFTGHTEFFAQCAGVKDTVMLFVVDQLKVALATIHVPLARVPLTLTKDSLQTTLTILHDSLQKYFRISSPRLLVCGLNPHAGEGGYLGREEIDIIEPVIAALRKQHYHIDGPLAADTIFTPMYLREADAILAMYHDQALPLVKYIGFGNAVNVTLGLPFVRTSVDHGTALDVAGTGKADAGSLLAAIRLAIQIT
ncbi:4-hydroxythreonine-4-phosphate dehydrogenase PdxA [Aquicella lusitana]|nr:4-hydroxythreonine-4-phosphate dehydrogenase [Aquicella lusitana]